MTRATRDSVQEWWDSIRSGAPDRLVGLWFGLVELDPGGWHLYVAGTDEFDPADANADWAVGPYAWWPDDRYLPFPGIVDLPGDEALRTAAVAVRSLEPWADMDVEGVATGWDDGDYLIVWPED